jgi:Flp pilus assembly protein TadD
MIIGGGRRRRRGNSLNGALALVLLLAVVFAGGYFLVQNRLGNGVAGLGGNATPLPTLTPTLKVEDFTAKAEDAYQKGNLSEAISNYEQAIRRKPNDADLQIKVARLYIFSGRAALAEQRLTKIVQLDPKNAIAKAMLGMAMDWQGRSAEALAMCQSAAQIDPGNSIVLANLAETQTDNNDFQGAVASATKAIALDAKNVDAIRNLAYAYEQYGYYSQAVTYYKQAAALHENLAHIQLGLGRTYMLLDVSQALKPLRRAVELDPNNAESREDLGAVNAYLGEREQSLNVQTGLIDNAVVDYTHAFSIGLATKATLLASDYLNYGIALQMQSASNCPKAITLMQQAADLAPGDDKWQTTVKSYLAKCRK